MSKAEKKLYRLSIGTPDEFSHYVYVFRSSPEQIMHDAKRANYETKSRRILNIEENPDIFLSAEQQMQMTQMHKRLRREEHQKYLREKEEKRNS